MDAKYGCESLSGLPITHYHYLSWAVLDTGRLFEVPSWGNHLAEEGCTSTGRTLAVTIGPR